ncbi:ABC transporter substrate-binding protein [Cognatitamlana onchidii]|uniref:ABC transporter substrate-binding protein n=1 Tax=Cognatitamlana onchidii TaxID=2562860 RepID=UPI0010A638C5|nr:ABC transporter substrate-binding protein [Algibacter onchidii]
MKTKNIFLITIAFLTLQLFTGCDKSKEIKEEKTTTESYKELIKLKVAGYDLDRLEGIVNGKIKIEGCEVEFHKIGIGDANTAAFSGTGTYDVTEIGLNPYMLAYANDNFRDYTLIPVFPIRVFRHKSIFIHSDRGINNPEDLKGRKIGTPGYSSTSLTWIRGMLQDEYGVSPNDIDWVLSNKDSSADTAGKISKEEQVVPEGITARYGTAGKDESELLLSGEVDALFHAAEPNAFVKGNPKVKRLFADARATERAYFKKTGIFPIMHAVAIKTALIKKHPWLPKAVFEAYSKAKTQHYIKLKKVGWAYSSLPWFAQEFEETRKLMGDNFWPYGIEANRKALETLFRYSYEQGLSSKHLTINELFEASTLTLKEN